MHRVVRPAAGFSQARRPYTSVWPVWSLWHGSHRCQANAGGRLLWVLGFDQFSSDSRAADGCGSFGPFRQRPTAEGWQSGPRLLRRDVLACQVAFGRVMLMRDASRTSRSRVCGTPNHSAGSMPISTWYSCVYSAVGQMLLGAVYGGDLLHARYVFDEDVPGNQASTKRPNSASSVLRGSIALRCLFCLENVWLTGGAAAEE